MASYIVLEPADVLKPAVGDKTIFVRDEFTVFALILPFLWLLVHRLWWHALMIAVIGWGAFGVLGSYLSSGLLVSALSILLSVFVALEGRNWHLMRLRRKGYKEVALISAANQNDAETVYFYGVPAPVERKESGGSVSANQSGKNPLVSPALGNVAGEVAPQAGNAMIGLVEYRGRS